MKKKICLLEWVQYGIINASLYFFVCLPQTDKMKIYLVEINLLSLPRMSTTPQYVFVLRGDAFIVIGRIPTSFYTLKQKQLLRTIANIGGGLVTTLCTAKKPAQITK